MTHTQVGEQQNKVNRGGRPEKEALEKATIKINCWVTPVENEQLLTAYIKFKAGRKLAFSTFLKQLLLEKRHRAVPKRDELLLTLLIQLQEDGHKLDAILELIKCRQNQSGEPFFRMKIEEGAQDIKETITKITAWLYES